MLHYSNQAYCVSVLYILQILVLLFHVFTPIIAIYLFSYSWNKYGMSKFHRYYSCAISISMVLGL